MKTLLLFSVIILLFCSHKALTISSESPLEGYKAYLRGVCAATSTDCDLSFVSSCWNDESASKALNVIHQACKEVVNSPPQESSNVLHRFFVEDAWNSMRPIRDAFACEENFLSAQQFYEKVGSEKGFDVIIANVIHYASVRPENTFTMLKNMAMLAEQGNFEAVGLMDGNFMSQAAALRKKEGSDWRKNAKEGRRLLLKGLCEALAIDCPMDTLNCMDEQNSFANLEYLYEWFKSVATQPIATGAQNGVDYLLGRGTELRSRISLDAIAQDETTAEVRLMNEKLGVDVWSLQWRDIVIAGMKAAPESTWHYKVSEYRLFENNDLEAVGVVVGIAWYHVAQWEHGRSGNAVLGSDEDL